MSCFVPSNFLPDAIFQKYAPISERWRHRLRWSISDDVPAWWMVSGEEVNQWKIFIIILRP